MIDIHTHQPSGMPAVVEIVNRYPSEEIGGLRFFSTGIHPWYLKEETMDDELRVLEQRLSLPECLALGECGLDKRIDVPFDLQMSAFERQLELAIRYRKPVILHCVAAHQELIETQKRLGIDVPLIVHGFSKNRQIAESLLKHGFYLSFGKHLLRNPALGEVFKEVPDTRFFLETDTMEEGIATVYEKAARLRNMPLEALSDQVNATLLSVFGRQV